MRYRVEFEGNDDIGYSAYLSKLAGCVAAAETFDETVELISEAVGLHVELMEEEELPIPEPAPLIPRGGAYSFICPERVCHSLAKAQANFPCSFYSGERIAAR